MASHSPLLSTFLEQAKSDFLTAVQNKEDLSHWIICTGNEAGDLDSLASSISFSYFSSLSPLSSSPLTRYLPLLQTHAPDLHLRPENLYALSSASIPPSSLLCIDQLPSSSSSILTTPPSKGGPTYALVDHNVLLPHLRATPPAPANDEEEEEEQVIAILDHHADEGQHLSASPRLIQPVGSCVSLVVQHFLLPPSPSPSPSAELNIPQGLADLILSSILIDTGLKPSTSGGGKATEVDLAAVNLLLPFASPSFSVPAPSTDPYANLLALNRLLVSKKFAISHLNGRDLLRRDYKEYDHSSAGGQGWKYGLSTVPLPLSSWLSKSEGGRTGWELVLKEVEKWKEERGLRMVGVLTSFDLPVPEGEGEGGKKGKQHKRELLVHVGVGDGAEGEGLLGGLLEGLEKEGTLGLGAWKGGQAPNGGGAAGWRVWQQGNVKATRKQVAPVIKALLQAL